MSEDQVELSPHRQRKHTAMREQILSTAREIMREQGVAALSMQELARRMDLRAPSLYHYFTGKLEIYDALFRLGFELYAQEVERVRAAAQTWQDFTARSFNAYLNFAQHNPELYQLCFERPVPGFVPSALSLEVSTGLLQRAYTDMRRFEDRIDSGLTPEQTVDLFIALMHGITAMHMANEPGTPAGQGRFGSLIPPAMALLSRAWAKS